MTILKSRAHIHLAVLIASGSAALLGTPEALGEAKAKMDWPKYFTKRCESVWKDEMSESELGSTCSYHARSGSAYATRALHVGPTIAPAASTAPCIKTLVKYHERQCPLD